MATRSRPRHSPAAARGPPAAEPSREDLLLLHEQHTQRWTKATYQFWLRAMGLRVSASVRKQDLHNFLFSYKERLAAERDLERRLAAAAATPHAESRPAVTSSTDNSAGQQGFLSTIGSIRNAAGALLSRFDLNNNHARNAPEAGQARASNRSLRSPSSERGFY